jgi:starch-binding outer membrane protein, SusD/RagB family
MKIHLCILLGIFCLASCDYLNVVPKETTTEADAFEGADNAKAYLYGCYSYIPDDGNVYSPALLTSDEMVESFTHEVDYSFGEGIYTAASPIVCWWGSYGSSSDNLWEGIRKCYIFLNNIDGVEGITSDELISEKAEAKFLIAYYHHELLQAYGPIPIMTKAYATGATAATLPERSPYDSCVNWIAKLYDEAANSLPSTRTGDEYGRATSVAAKALKARLLLYAASPQFNGDQGKLYTSFKSPTTGANLINETYDGSKWTRAAQAAKAAIDSAEANGATLYTGTNNYSTFPMPTSPYIRAEKFAFSDYYNSTEVLWAHTPYEGKYGKQNRSVPFNSATGWNGISPTMKLIRMFYTNNGLPIDQDSSWTKYYNDQFGYAQWTGNDTIAKVGANVQYENWNREPRYYAWIAFHNGMYDITRADMNGKTWLGGKAILCNFTYSGNCGINGRTNNYSPGGFLTMKYVPPTYSLTQCTADGVYYPWPTIRLAELYLDYAEALIEQPSPDLATARAYIDKVRARGGLPSVVNSWGGQYANSNAWNYQTQDGMRQIVRRERTIEFFGEGQRFWDLRRWLLADQYLGVQPTGLNIEATTEFDLFKETPINVTRKFDSKNYLLPIPSNEIDMGNGRIVQNPGY